MAETKEEIAAERDHLARENDTLQSENERLKAQLAAAGRPAGVTTPQHTFQLSQGDLSELERNGWVSIGGKVMTTEEVRAELAAVGQGRVEIAEPENPQVPMPVEGGNVRGFDFVYPSVARGQIDPAVAGTPGISGPAAETR